MQVIVKKHVQTVQDIVYSINVDNVVAKKKKDLIFAVCIIVVGAVAKQRNTKTVPIALNISVAILTVQIQNNLVPHTL